MTASSGDRPGLGRLLRELVEESVSLVRDEFRLVKVESVRAASAIGRGSALLAFGSVLAVLGALAIITGVALVAGDQWLPADRYWLAALIGLVITGAVALWLARRGLASLAPREIAPVDTLQTLKEDTQWVKRRLT